MELVKLDSVKLKSIAESNHTAAITMLALGLRERSRDLTNTSAIKIQLLRMGEKIVDEDYVKFWQDLQAAGIGSFIVGRRGNPDRFKWHYSLKEIARIAIDGKESEAKELIMKKQSQVPVTRRRKRRSFKRSVAKAERKRKPGRPHGSKNRDKLELAFDLIRKAMAG